MLPPSTCFTGSRLVPVDRRGNVLKCYILLTAFGSQFSIASSRYVQTPAREKENREREREKWQRVCSHATPPNSDCKNEWPVSPVSLLASHPPSPPPPALYLLMDPFNYLPHILGRQQARAQYIRWRWYSRHAQHTDTELVLCRISWLLPISQRICFLFFSFACSIDW